MTNSNQLINFPAVTIEVVTALLLICLLIVAVGILRSGNILTVIIISSMFSLLMAAIFTTLQAPDVALTEAVVGAGISSLLIMATCVVAGIETCKKDKFSFLALFATALVTGLLLYATLDMPPYGAFSNPVHQRVVPYYLQYSYEDNGISNVVTVILASYRGFDTLGESVVILIAGLGVLSLLRTRAYEPGQALLRPEKISPIRTISILLLPAIILFAFYILFHGDVSPGGAFQAGVLFAVAIAIYTLIVGYNAAARVFSRRRLLTLAGIGISMYFGVGLLSILMGGQFLEYGVFLEDNQLAQHIAIFVVEIGIACNVAAVLVIIFHTVVSYPPLTRN